MEISNIKKAIEEIKSVESCGIITDQDNNIDEIHIVANFDRNPLQISSDIQAVTKSRFDIDIDQSKISIAQLKDVGVKKTEEYRLKLKKIEYSLSENKSEVKVILEKDEVVVEAMVSGSNTRFNTQRIISTATLRATERFLEKEGLFLFEDVKIVDIASDEVVIVSVVAMESGHEKRLFGCAHVNRDLNESVVRATLNAINRKVTLYMNS